MGFGSRGFGAFWRKWRRAAPIAALLPQMTGCHHESGPSLERTEESAVPPIPDVAPPPADGPRLGAIASRVTVYDRPSKRGNELGTLRAGATVARAPTPFTKTGCEGGFYAVHPRGFVCVGAGATTDLGHPTLVAMALQPNREAALPFTYARAVRDTASFVSDDAHEGRVRAVGSLRARSAFAVVGSWTADVPAPNANGAKLRLAMTTDGRFVPAKDLEALTPSSFSGVTLGEDASLPLAFVVKRGVHAFTFAPGNASQPQKNDALDYHARVALTGKHRVVAGVEFWSTKDGKFVRLTDVTLLRERHEFPQFAEGSRRWIDVSVVTGTLVAYEGKTPKFATLVSVGRDRLGTPALEGVTDAPRITGRGEFTLVGKALTVTPPLANAVDAAGGEEGALTYGDRPWALELSSGQRIVGAYWHDRFGIEHGDGDVEVSPPDAATLFRFVQPEVPPGWHTVNVAQNDRDKAETAVIVNIRK